MMPQKMSRRVVTDRLEWVDKMLVELRSLPLDSREKFFADKRNTWTAESCLRRALEALLDLGRHILAKGFATGVSEYKEIAQGLSEHGILSPDDAGLLRTLAGYRNRMVHFYHEVSAEELYETCSTQLGDVEHLVNALKTWLAGHTELLDDTL
ncbi:MAG: DUF86 domain-containing protein [Chloroflexota bacterium]